MGLVTKEPKIETTNHFSHKHPLKLITHQNQIQHSSSTCVGCKFVPSGSIYSCTICPFFLHKKCFETPRTINHPGHKAHRLTLLPKPAYPTGEFGCDGCGNGGNGFSYHCKPCGQDFHLLCADFGTVPRSIKHASHPHKLDLAFECPYVTKCFLCDMCRKNGSDQWAYRCNQCGFDAHVNCVTGYLPPLPPQQLQPPQHPPLLDFTSLQARLDALAQQSQPMNFMSFQDHLSDNTLQPPSVSAHSNMVTSNFLTLAMQESLNSSLAAMAEFQKTYNAAYIYSSRPRGASGSNTNP